MSNEHSFVKPLAVEPKTKKSRDETPEEMFLQACTEGKSQVVDDLWDKVSSEFKANTFIALFDKKLASNFLWEKFSNEEKSLVVDNACKSSNLDLLKKMVKAVKEAEKVLFLVFKYADLTCVKFFVEKNNIDINKPTSLLNKITLFHGACLNPHVEVVRYLCEERAADLTVRDSRGADGFLYACMSGRPDVVEYLRGKMGRKIYQKDIHGLHVLHVAAMVGHLAAVEYLCPLMGKSISDQTKEGKTPLQLACEQGHRDVAHFLFEKQFDTLSLEQISRYLYCHESVRPIVKIFYALKQLHTNCRPGSLLAFLEELISRDIQLFDRVLLRNVFCGSPEAERVYQLNEAQKNQLVHELRGITSEQAWLRFIYTCFDVLNNPQSEEAAKSHALFCAILFLDTLMRYYPDNKCQYEVHLTAALKCFLHKEESTETLSTMKQHYSPEIRKLIDEISKYFIEREIVKPGVRVLPGFYEECFVAQIAALEAENAGLRAGQTATHVKFMLQGKSSTNVESNKNDAVARSDNNSSPP